MAISVASSSRSKPVSAPQVRTYAEALMMVGASTLVGLVIAPQWGNGPIDLLYLPAVLGAALLCGRGPALLAAIASTVAYNFFFTAPQLTLLIRSPADVVTVVILLAVALVTSHLAAEMRQQARLAEAHAARNATIAGLSRRLLSCSSQSDVAAIAVDELSRLFECNAVLVTGQEETDLVASSPAQMFLNPSDRAAAVLTLGTGQEAGRATEQGNLADWQFHPVASDHGVIAAIGFARDDGAPPVTEDQRSLLTNLLDQVALALDRARLESETRAFAATRERDRIRSVLFASIGEDLKPRINAILAAARALRRAGLSDRALVSTVASEVSKLDRYVENLVDLSPVSDRKPVEVGAVRIDLFERSVRKDGRVVHLTPKEYAVLAELARQPGRVLTHSHLLRSVWGPAHQRQIDYLRVAVSALRQKLERNPADPEIIINEPAVGYRLSHPS